MLVNPMNFDMKINRCQILIMIPQVWWTLDKGFSSSLSVWGNILYLHWSRLLVFDTMPHPQAWSSSYLQNFTLPFISHINLNCYEIQIFYTSTSMNKVTVVNSALLLMVSAWLVKYIVQQNLPKTDSLVPDLTAFRI